MVQVSASDDSLDDLLDGLRSFLKSEVFPRHDAFEEVVLRGGLFGEDGRFRPELRAMMLDVRTASARAGYYTMLLPEELGGADLGYTAFFRVWEMIYYECGGTHPLGYQAVAHWSRGVSHLLALGTPELRARVLGDLADGTKTICFAMSEPEAGSDAWNMRTRAEQDSSGRWHLNGTKQWITNGPLAEYALTFAVTNPELVKARKGGVTAFFVPTSTPGFAIDSVIRMFGELGGDEAIISLDDVIVENDAVIGEVDQGFKLAIAGVSMGRLYNSARGIGLARWSLETAIEYACERKTFGETIFSNQGVSFPLADCAMAIHAARLVGLDCASLLDQGKPARMELSMAKVMATEAAVRTVDVAMQTCGAMGFTNEMHLFDAWVQARKTVVADGSSEILRRAIAQRLQAGDRV
jgi:acyl-CoA dehydrogenase